jgi:phospholipase/carboxylesterase
LADLQVFSADPEDGPATAAIIAIHGRGANASDLVGIADMLDLPGVRWVFPQGWMALPHAFGTGWAWYDMPPRDRDGVVESRRRLTWLLDRVTAEIPAERTVVAGFSQGAVMTLDVGLRYPKRLAGLAPLSGYLHDPAAAARDLSPAQRATPVFLAHGTLDDVIPVAGSRAAAAFLEGAKIPVEAHEYPMGHQISADEVADLRSFVARVLAR